MFKEILSKVSSFESNLVNNIKQNLLEKLIQKETSSYSSNWYLANCAILGITVAHMITHLFFSKNMSFWLFLLSIVYIILGSSYVTAYLKRHKTKKTVIDRIKKIEKVKELYGYINSLEAQYLYTGVLFNEGKIEELSEDLSYISAKDVKVLLSNLSEEELNQVKDIFKYHLNDKNFNIDLLNGITERCNKEIEKREKEEIFDNILKNKSEEEKDLLDLMLDECSSEKEEKLKINFKEVL